MMYSMRFSTPRASASVVIACDHAVTLGELLETASRHRGCCEIAGYTDSIYSFEMVLVRR